jgi:hypothetical protein
MAVVTDERIMSATRKAEEAFWEAVAKEFPEATSGDLDPGAAVNLTQAMERAVRTWVDYNVTPESDGQGEP